MVSKVKKKLRDLRGSIQDEIEYPKGSIYELIEKTAEAYPFNIAYEYFGKKVTYREFMIQIKKCFWFWTI